MKKIMMIGILLASLLSSACITIPSVGEKDYKYNQKDIVSYGVDNNWMNIDEKKLATILKENGLTMTSIEFMGWANGGYYANPNKLKGPYKDFIKMMRRYGIVTFISLTNDNKGSGKYGDDHKSLADYKVQIRQALDIVIAEGPEGVIVQPVAETYTSEGTKFEAEAIQKLKAKGFKTCWNHGSRPKGSNGCTYFAYHPASTKDVGAKGALTITDHGNLLRELNNGNVYGYGNPSKVGAYAKKVHSTGVNGFGYYGFGHSNIDEPSVKAIGAATKAKAKEVETKVEYNEFDNTEEVTPGWRSTVEE